MPKLGAILSLSAAANGAGMSGGGTPPTPFVNTYSVDFDGVDQYVEAAIDGTSTGNFGSGAAKEFTISFWLNANQATGVAFNWGDTHSSLYPYVLIYTNTGYITYLMWTGAGVPTWLVSTIAYPLGAWGHIALSRTASDNTWRLYINGVADTTIDDTGTTDSKEANAQKVFLGEGVYAATLGNIDEVSMFTTALSQSDITSIYNGGVPTDLSSLSPVAWYRMGDGAVYPMINNEQAYSNRSVEFDGVDDYVDLGRVEPSTTALSISLWVYVTSSGTSQGLFTKYSSQDYGVTIWGSTLYFFIKTASWDSISVSSFLSSYSNQWVHICCTWDGSTRKIYLNGSEAATGAKTGSITYSTNNTRLGNLEGAGGFQFGGNMDEVAIWGSGLSPSNVTTIYNSGVPNDISGLSPVGWWRMGEGDTYPTLTDSGSGSNDGTMTNMVADDITGAQSTGIMENMVSGDIVADVP